MTGPAASSSGRQARPWPPPAPRICTSAALARSRGVRFAAAPSSSAPRFPCPLTHSVREPRPARKTRTARPYHSQRLPSAHPPRPATTSRSHRENGVASCQLPVVSCQWPAVICHLSFAICHLPFAICHLPFAICHLPFAICHLPFVICH